MNVLLLVSPHVQECCQFYSCCSIHWRLVWKEQYIFPILPRDTQALLWLCSSHLFKGHPGTVVVNLFSFPQRIPMHWSVFLVPILRRAPALGAARLHYLSLTAAVEARVAPQSAL